MIKQMTTQRTNCRLCDSSNLELALPIRPSPIGDAFIKESELNKKQESFSLDLYLCRNCGHLQLLDIIDPQLLFANYIYSTATSPGLVDHFKQYAATMINRIQPPQNSFIVEMGSNDGSLLRAFKNCGMRTLGIDPAYDIACKATQNGTETIPSFFTSRLAKQIKVEYGEATIFAANNVFAHIDNMHDVAEGIRHLLAQDGVFVFEVSYIVDMIEKHVFDTIYHEHVSYHSIIPLETFLNKHGMKLFDIQRISSKGGSIRGFAQLLDGTRKTEPIVAELMSYENQINLYSLDIYKNLYYRLENIKNDIEHVLKKMKLENKIIIGYGASPSTTTLTYHFELGHYLDFIVDENPIKQGRFSPGQHLPVLHPDMIAEKNVDCIVILAWQYAEKIIQKQQQFLERGGCFIVPLPEMKINQLPGFFANNLAELQITKSFNT